jgi:hypothetical protein
LALCLIDNIVYSITHITYHQLDGHFRLPVSSSSISPRCMAFFRVSGLLEKSCVPMAPLRSFLVFVGCFDSVVLSTYPTCVSTYSILVPVHRSPQRSTPEHFSIPIALRRLLPNPLLLSSSSPFFPSSYVIYDSHHLATLICGAIHGSVSLLITWVIFGLRFC